MFSGKKVKWEHFGKKYQLRISDYEMEYADLYDVSHILIVIEVWYSGCNEKNLRDSP